MGGFSLLVHCSHLISIGRWLADMSLRLACLLIGGRRRRGRSRIGLFGSERWHIRQFRQIAVLPVSILEFGFPTSGIRSHLASGSTDCSRWARVSSGLSSRNARYNDRTSHYLKFTIHPMLPSKKYHQRWIRVSWSTWRGSCLSDDENALRNA